MTRKNPAAVSLGRLGGKANTAKQNAARKKNSLKSRRCPLCKGGWRSNKHKECKKGA